MYLVDENYEPIRRKRIRVVGVSQVEKTSSIQKQKDFPFF
jgi:hypothetical protein